MKRIVINLFLCVTCVGCFVNTDCFGGNSGTYSDETIAGILVRSVQFCHPKDKRSEREYAFSRCGYDTNHFTRIIQNLVMTNEEISTSAVRWLGDYGTTNNLPFLYDCLTNVVLGKYAVYSVLKIEGATSNSVIRIGDYLSLTNNPLDHRRNAGFDLIQAVARKPPSDVTHKMVVEKILGYVKDENVYPDLLDIAIIKADPTYQFSKRRLSALRSAYALGLNQYAVTYITNAINELVAYPEVNLPE